MATQTRQVVVSQTLAAAIADAGTLTLSYPSGTNQAYFTSGNAKAASVAIINDSDIWLQTASKIGVTFGASDITLTNSSGVSWAAGSKLVVGLAYADGTDKFEGQKSAAITALTDSSGGTASTTLAAISASYSQTEVRNSIATLASQIERLRAALSKANIIA